MSGVADKIIAHYEKHARVWDELRQSSVWNDWKWHDRFVDGLKPGASVLDLGCGSGRPVAQFMNDRGLYVTGVDSSRAMISLCRSRLPNHEWIVADMRQLGLGRRFQSILAWDSFFHLDHTAQRKMFAVFQEHAAAGARLMFNAGPDHGEAIGEFEGDALYHASLSPLEYEMLISEYGFEIVAQNTNDPTAGGRTVYLCQSRESVRSS
jgi:SAM-dependent methyltransferase